jgi:hypothetical protein
MAIQADRPLRTKGWRDLYVAALLEGNTDKIPSLIADAEWAIVQRARELFKAEGTTFRKRKAWTTHSTPSTL